MTIVHLLILLIILSTLRLHTMDSNCFDMDMIIYFVSQGLNKCIRNKILWSRKIVYTRYNKICKNKTNYLITSIKKNCLQIEFI